MNTHHIRIKVTTGTKRERLTEKGGVFFIATKELKQENRANRRIVQMVATHFGVPASSVRIVAGHHAPNKTLEIKDSTK